MMIGAANPHVMAQMQQMAQQMATTYTCRMYYPFFSSRMVIEYDAAAAAPFVGTTNPTSVQKAVDGLADAHERGTGPLKLITFAGKFVMPLLFLGTFVYFAYTVTNIGADSHGPGPDSGPGFQPTVLVPIMFAPFILMAIYMLVASKASSMGLAAMQEEAKRLNSQMAPVHFAISSVVVGRRKHRSTQWFLSIGNTSSAAATPQGAPLVVQAQVMQAHGVPPASTIQAYAQPAGASFCPSCGAARSPGANFCGSCGHAFASAPEFSDAA